MTAAKWIDSEDKGFWIWISLSLFPSLSHSNSISLFANETTAYGVQTPAERGGLMEARKGGQKLEQVREAGSRKTKDKESNRQSKADWFSLLGWPQTIILHS